MLHISPLRGRDLELSKCGWYVIDWGLDINDKPQIQKTKHNIWITTPLEIKHNLNIWIQTHLQPISVSLHR